MTAYQLTQASDLGLDRALSSWSFFVDSHPLFANTLVEPARRLTLGAYSGFQSLMAIHMGTDTASRIVSPELVDLESGFSNQGVPNTSQRSGNNPFDSAAEGSEGVDQTGDGDQHSRRASSPLSSRTWMRMPSLNTGMHMPLLNTGALSVILVPGLVLGVTTGQLMWGLALCGAIATVLGFFFSLNKED